MKKKMLLALATIACIGVIAYSQTSSTSYEFMQSLQYVKRDNIATYTTEAEAKAKDPLANNPSYKLCYIMPEENEWLYIYIDDTPPPVYNCTPKVRPL
jgi:hypothetical protein